MFQVTEETCEILKQFGYQFEQRGLVSVKGKGQLMTYYLTGKGDPPAETACAEVLSTDQISIDPSGCDSTLSEAEGLKSAASTSSATHLLPTPNEEWGARARGQRLTFFSEDQRGEAQNFYCIIERVQGCGSKRRRGFIFKCDNCVSKRITEKQVF